MIYARGVKDLLCNPRYCEVPTPPSGLPAINSTRVLTALSVAISHDEAVSFSKPLLHQIDFRGSTANNIILFAGDTQCIPQCGGEMEGGSVWIDEHGDPSERYKNIAKSTWPTKESGIHLWVSADGYKWRYKANWVVGRVDTQQVAFFDRDMNEYALYTRANTDNYPVSVRRLSNKTLPGNSSWSGKHTGIALSSTVPDALDDSTHPYGSESAFVRHPTEFGGATPWKVADTAMPTYFMFIQQHWPWRLECRKHTKGCAEEGCARVPPDSPCFPVDVRLATSRDGKTWARGSDNARQALLGLGMAGSWNSRGMWALPQPLEVNVTNKYSGIVTPELRVFFHGRNTDNRARVDPATIGGELREGIGFARFRLDGLVGLRAGYGTPGRGRAITRPLSFGPASGLDASAHEEWRLLLNLDAGAGGVAYIELLSPAGEVLPGFSRAEAIATATNSLEAVVRWRSPVNNKTLGNVASLLGKPIRIAFELEDAVLYTFRFARVA